MAQKPSYEELEKRVGELEQQVLNRKQAEETLWERSLESELKKFQVLYDLAVAMTADRSLDENLRLVVDKRMDLLGADTAYIALRDESRGDVYMHTLSGIRTEAFKNLRLPFGKGLGGLVAKTRKGYTVDLYSAEKNIEHVVDNIVAEEGVISGMAVPIQMGLKNVGVLYVFNRTKTAFSQSDLDTLFLIGNLAAVEITRKRAEEALRDAYDNLETIVQERTTELINMNDELKREIEERKQAEDALRESEAKYRELIQYSNSIILRRDSNGNITFFNEFAQSFFGYTEDEILGKNVVGTIVPEIETTGRDLAEMIKDIGKHPERYKTNENENILRNGERVWISWTNKRIRNEDRGIEEILCIGNDITQLKRAEGALRESEGRYRVLADSSLTGIYIYQDNKFIYVNDRLAQMLGYMPTEMLERNYFQFVHPEDREIVMKYGTGRAKGLPAPSHFEFRALRKDGGFIWCEILATTIKYKGRTANMGNFLDITERKRVKEEKRRLEAQLQQAERLEAIGTLAGGIAHDFNNLLMGVQGNASLMLLHVDTSHPHYEKLKNIEKYVRNGADLTKQLLGFARSGKYEVQPTDPNDLVKKSSDMFVRTKKEISIHPKYQKGIWTVEVDQGQIEQVLLNLYVNAWQAMPGGGELYLQTENVTFDEGFSKSFVIEAGKYVKISVTDTGLGMDDATQERIFEPFFTTKEMGRGTGLGLASVYGIIRNHGGIINVYSEKGKGTTFNIYLPASEKEVIEDKILSEEVLKGTETVLLVDDEEMITGAGGELLEEIGYRVLIAGSGKEAIELYEKDRDEIDLVILDMTMPVMGGGETYDRLKETNPDIKVLLSSGYSIDGEASEILGRGCSGFIQKPFNVKELSQKMREILNG